MEKNKMTLMEKEPKSCKEIFAAVNRRQITALMFHDDMADLFDFLGLRGFKRMHEYQFFEESAEHRALKRYYLNHHGELIPEEELDRFEVIPSDWYKYTRMDVSAPVRKQAVQRAMEQYHDWESETKELYEACAKYLLDWGAIADFNKICDLVKDVDMELKYLERLCIELKSVDYSAEYIGVMQDKYHEAYKEKCKDIGVDIC